MTKLDRALRNLADFIRETHSDLSAPSIQRQDALPEVMFSQKAYGTLILSGEDAAKWRQVLDSIASAAGEGVSKKFVEQQTQKCVLHALDIFGETGGEFEKRLAANGDALRSQLVAPRRLWQVHLRVCGLASEGLPMRLGHVTFLLLDAVGASSLSASFAAIIDSSRYTDGEKEALKQRIKDGISGSLGGAVTAVVDVAAVDPEAATELAIVELRRTADIINFYSDFLVSGGLRCRVYLPQEAAKHNEVIPALTQDGEPAQFHLDYRVVGPLQDFPPALLASPKASELGFDRAIALLEKGDRSKVEDALLAALQLGGQATVHDRREEAFLLYIICIESLVVPSKTEGITYRLSISLPHLLGRDDLEARKRIARIVRDLYGKRSAIAHSGRAEITDSDFQLARFVAKNTILRFLQEPFIAMKKFSDVEVWFEEHVLS